MLVLAMRAAALLCRRCWCDANATSGSDANARVNDVIYNFVFDDDRDPHFAQIYAQASWHMPASVYVHACGAGVSCRCACVVYVVWWYVPLLSTLLS